MNATVYLGQAARDHIDAAQVTVDAHVLDAATARCLPCRTEWPCPPATEALATLTRYRRLPRRRPGATRPELLTGAATGTSTGQEMRRMRRMAR